MSAIRPIHPFPARMAPEIALAEMNSLTPDSLVLDPMVGSGTTLRIAAEHGHRGLGFDKDPLAVLMTNVWTTPIDPQELCCNADNLIQQSAIVDPDAVSLPWIDNDSATCDFIDFWFGEKQIWDLRRIASVLHTMDDGAISNALRLALSRIIITKDRGASLARDVSHSRPHRVRTENDYSVIDGFSRSVRDIAKRLKDQPPPGNVAVRSGDARDLHEVASASVDAVITSPPYLNAIDYLRGHRLALVWLGYRLGELRNVRVTSVGTERMADSDMDMTEAKTLSDSMKSLDALPERERRIVERYIFDMQAVVTELHRVLRPGGEAIFVVGNSCLRGVFIENSRAIIAASERAGFRCVRKQERDLPPSRRYLPAPTYNGVSDLTKRMRTEDVLTFVRS